MHSRRRLIVVLLVLALACAGVATLWRWKAPGIVRRRLEQAIGHRATIGGVSLNHRLEVVVSDVRIAGAPPFESQTLARADRIVVRLRGPGGFFSPSAVVINGLDIEYLGTAAGDNLHVPSLPAKTGTSTNKSAGPNAFPTVIARHVRIRGSVALAHAPLIEFRVPQAEFQRSSDGTVQAALQHLVVDAVGVGSLRVRALSAQYDHRRLSISSGGNVAVEVPGGGTLIENLSLTGTLSVEKAAVEIQRRDAADKQTLLVAHWQPGAFDLAVDAHDVPLHALGVAVVNRAIGLESAKASVHASITVDHARADFEFQTRVGGIDLLHPAIDLVPWRNQAASLNLRGTADLASGRIEIASGDLKALAVPLSFRGWVDLLQAPRGSIELSTRAPLACGTLLMGQPAPVKQALSGLELEGKLGFKLAVDFDASAWEDLGLDLAVEPVCEVRREANALASLLPILLNPSAKGQTPTILPLSPLHPDFIPLSQMPQHLPSAFLTSEDSKFYHHRGFDLDMIRHALAQDLHNRSFDRGASTITQQLAKNLFLSHRRTLARKLEEAVLTWRLQKLLSKDRVLELYLNVIELGPSIRGVKQAAHVYFGKDVAELTPLESAHLAALTPNPHVLARRFRDGQVDEGWQHRLYDLLGMMKRNGRLSKAELAAARGSKLVLRDLSQDVAAHGTQ